MITKKNYVLTYRKYACFVFRELSIRLLRVQALREYDSSTSVWSKVGAQQPLVVFVHDDLREFLKLYTVHLNAPVHRWSLIAPFKII